MTADLKNMQDHVDNMQSNSALDKMKMLNDRLKGPSGQMRIAHEKVGKPYL